MLSALVALSENRTIGKNGKLPWHITEDLKFFRQVTMDHPMVMGRKTFDALPHVLDGREHLIVTHNREFVLDHPQVHIIHDIQWIIDTYKDTPGEVFVIGGGEIFQHLLPHCHKLYLTLIHAHIAGDTYMPAIDLSNYHMFHQSEKKYDEASGLSYTFKFYQAL